MTRWTDACERCPVMALMRPPVADCSRPGNQQQERLCRQRRTDWTVAAMKRLVWRSGELVDSVSRPHRRTDQGTMVRNPGHFKLDALRNASVGWSVRRTHGLSVVSRKAAARRRSRPTADAVAGRQEGRSRLRCRNLIMWQPERPPTPGTWPNLDGSDGVDGGITWSSLRLSVLT